MLRLLRDREYLPKLIEGIGQARQSVQARIFLMDPGIPEPSPLRELFTALALARERGAEVTLETAALFAKKPTGKRLLAFAKRFSIPIRWRGTPDFLHEKSVTVDGKIHFIGSHNWTPSSLLENREVTLQFEEGEARVLDAQGFRRELLGAIRNAREEVTLASYDMDDIGESDRDFSDEVARQLVFLRMKNRKARILLDASLAERPGSGRSSAGGGDVVLYRGRRKAEEMARWGVHVYYDTTQALFHAKLAVIDDRVVFIGSQNIGPAREGEIEKTALFESQEIAGQIKTYLAGVVRNTERFRYHPLETPGVRVPLVWVRRGGVIAKLFQKKGKRTLDLLLALLHEAQRKRGQATHKSDSGDLSPFSAVEIPWETETLAQLSGIEVPQRVRKSPAKRRRFLQRILTQPRIFLKDQYHLIRYQARPWVPLASVTLLDGTKNRGQANWDKAAGLPVPYFVLPWEYWTNGWHKRLNSGERYAYFVHLAEVSQSPEAPIWSLRLAEIRRRYGISWQRFAKQTIRLERLNLIEVDRDPKIVLKNVFKRANRYRVNRLWSEAEEALGLKRLKEEFMAKETEFEEAKRLAGRLNQPHDLEVIRKFLILIERHGIEKVRKATRLTARFKPHFALRNVHHTGGILRNWEKGLYRDAE